MSKQHGPRTTDHGLRTKLLYHFCRMQLPGVELTLEHLDGHLQRTFELYGAKEGAAASWERYLDSLYPLDWFLAVACLEGERHAWEILFAARASRSDCLLVDALRARALRLYPRDLDWREIGVTDFWSHVPTTEAPGAGPVLAPYVGQRP